MYTYDEQTTGFIPGIEDSVFVIDVYRSPGTDWHVGFQQYNISMDAGDYKLCFDAHSEQADDLLITLSKNYVDWSAHVRLKQAITTITGSYELTFNMPVSDSNVRLFFGIGKFSGKFYIDNISLRKIEEGATGINQNQIANDRFSLFPNPVSDKLIFSLSNQTMDYPVQIQLMNLYGKVLLETIASGNESILDLSSFSPGVYLVVIRFPKSISTKTIVISR